MKQTALFSFLLAAFVLATGTTRATAQSTTAGAPNIEQEMVALAKAWQDAYNRGDAETLATMYANNVVFVNPADGTTNTTTKDAIKASLVKGFSEFTMYNEIKVISAVLQPDGKVNIKGTFSGYDTNKKTGEKIPDGGTFSHLVVKENGQWKLSQMSVVPNK
jgi:uncharacterized protein (TIGR02246 family)